MISAHKSAEVRDIRRRIADIAERLRLIWGVLRAPALRIRMWGGDEARQAYMSCVRVRNGAPFPRRVSFGMAVMPLPENISQPFAGPAFKSLRRRHRRAQSLGYSFAPFTGEEQIESVLAIHRSAPERQGIPMASSYMDAAAVARYLKARRSFYGVFDSQGALRAYCDWPLAGQAAVSARIMGDNSALKDGVMYFLVWEMALHFAREREKTGFPRWMSYGSFIGGRRQMRIFKRECGFRPRRVVCEWTGSSPAEPEVESRLKGDTAIPKPDRPNAGDGTGDDV